MDRFVHTPNGQNENITRSAKDSTTTWRVSVLKFYQDFILLTSSGLKYCRGLKDRPLQHTFLKTYFFNC